MAHPVDPLDIRTRTDDYSPAASSVNAVQVVGSVAVAALEQLPYGGHRAALTGGRVSITCASDPPE